jgi:membrane associated rhomboid family serine protease/Flp pilus assembly protein TadD
MMASGAASPQKNTLPAPAPGDQVLPPATAILIAINLLLFGLMAAKGGHLLKFDAELVLDWGGNYGPLTLGGQWWRLISSMFVHIGLAHIAINMWCLYELGSLSENLCGAFSMLLVYGLTGVAGGLASLARNATIISAGASGAIFGLAGFLIATLLVGKLPVRRRDLVIALASLLAFAAYNLTYGFLKGGIDNGAHLGGLVAGLLLGVALARDAVRHPRPRRREALVYGVGVAVLAGTFLAVRQARGAVVAVEAARQALGRGDPDTAIRRLSALSATGHSSPALALLGAAYGDKKQYAEAEQCYRRALQLDPRNFVARSGLGSVLAAAGRWPDALLELQKAARLNPGAEAVWLQLGTVLQKLGRHAEAISALQNAASLNPRSLPAVFAMGISEMNLRQYDAASAAFQKATQLAPDNYDAQIWLANAYQAAGRTNEAAAAYMRAARLRRSPLLRSRPH